MPWHTVSVVCCGRIHTINNLLIWDTCFIAVIRYCDKSNLSWLTDVRIQFIVVRRACLGSQCEDIVSRGEEGLSWLTV